MKLRKTIGKMLAMGTGAVMVGATILSATAAADLSNYPAPFVQDGKFNAVLVVGDAAASSDVVGSIDVATSLQFASRVKKSVQSKGGGQVSVSGEAWRVGLGAKKLEVSESLDAGAASSRQEVVRNITTFIGDDELPTLLADGVFSNTQGDYDYRQYFYFDTNPQTGQNNPSMSVVYAEDPDTNKAADYFYVRNGDNVARYSLEFTESAKSDVTDSAGTASSTGTFLWNFEGKSIKMLGRDWSIVKARTDNGAHNEVDLTLMGGATRDVLNEGDSRTYTIGGKDYEVTLDFVGSTTTKLTINGEVTDSLQEGTTQTLKDGTQIGIRDILAQDFAGGVRKTEFFLGADKIRLRDTRTEATAQSGEATLEVGTETITGTRVVIAGTNASTSYTLSSVAINMTADEDVYAPKGGKVSAQLRRPQAMLNSWDIEYHGLEPVNSEAIKLSPSGSTQYYLEFTDGAGNNAKLPIAYTSGGANVKLGDNDDDTITVENQSITRNDYFVVTDSSQKQGERRTYGLRYISALASTETSPKIEFQNLGGGGRLDVDYKAAAGEVGSATEDATLKLGGGIYKIWNATADGSINFDLKIDLDGDGSLEQNTTANSGLINVTTKGGAQVVLSFHPTNVTGFNNSIATNTVPNTIDANGGSILMSIQTPDADDYDNIVPSPIEFNISAASGKVDLSEVTTIPGSAVNLKYITPTDDTNLRQLYTSLGAYVNWKTVSNDPDHLDITYPDNSQALPVVVVTAPGAQVSSSEASEAGSIVYYETAPIAVGAAKLASEVGDITKVNAIVVGGPCANAAAAQLMGNPEPCFKDFTEGAAMLKLFENGGNVALLVAGYSASDTRRATKVIAEYDKWKTSLKGMDLEVKGVTDSDITVAPPAPKAAPVAEEPAPAAEEPAPAAEPAQ